VRAPIRSPRTLLSCLCTGERAVLGPARVPRQRRVHFTSPRINGDDIVAAAREQVSRRLEIWDRPSSSNWGVSRPDGEARSQIQGGSSGGLTAASFCSAGVPTRR
jgi:hypothetical protein